MIAAALARAGMIGLLAVAAAVPVARLRSPVAWILLLAGYLAPSLLVGYAYATFPFASYPVLLWLKLTPLAALILRFAPCPVSTSALHCYRLTHRGSIGFWFASGAARPYMTAFALVALIAFQEFELASLLSVKTWTVQLFDAHAGGLPLSRSLRLAAPPMLCELALLGVLLRQKPGVGRPSARPVFVPVAWTLVVATAVILLVLPAAIVLRGTLHGARAAAKFRVVERVGGKRVFRRDRGTAGVRGGTTMASVVVAGAGLKIAPSPPTGCY